MPIRAVSEETINKARSLAEMRGSTRVVWGGLAMDEIIASANLSNSKTIHIASLARQTIIDAGAEHMGFEGFFIFEVEDTECRHEIDILGKATSLEAAFRMADLWSMRPE
jgi:hypothetical protein